MNPNTKSEAPFWIGSAVIVIIILFILSRIFHSTGDPLSGAVATSTPTVQGANTTSITFICDGGNTIAANFTDTMADLSLSNGENMSLTQVDATSGARFENKDGTTALTILGPNVHLIENGVETFTNCIQPKG